MNSDDDDFSIDDIVLVKINHKNYHLSIICTKFDYRRAFIWPLSSFIISPLSVNRYLHYPSIK